MAEVGLVLTMAFFIRIVVTPIRNDDNSASDAANINYFFT